MCSYPHIHSLLQLQPVPLRHSSSTSLLLLLPSHSVSPPTIGRRYINISPFSALVVAPPQQTPPFPFSPRGYCLPLSAILSAACDQTGEPQCASEGPAEGGSQTPFNHVMPQLCQLVGCQTKIRAVYEVAARVSCPLRLPRTHRMSSS